MKSKFIIIVVFLFTSVSFLSQDLISPDSIFSTIDHFGYGCPCPIENITSGINSLVNENSTFPFETSTSFNSEDIGYLSSLGDEEVTISFIYNSPVDFSELYVWNAYFTTELDHSINTIKLKFYDVDDTIIDTLITNVPLADDSELTPAIIDFGTVLSNVSRIELHVINVHGGNETAVRRIAFKGELSPTDVFGPKEELSNFIISPNPAKSIVTIDIQESVSTELFLTNTYGQQLKINPLYENNKIIIDVSDLYSGLYFFHLETDSDTIIRKLIIK